MDPTRLGEVPLFATLSADQLDRIAKQMREDEFPSGSYIIERDDLSYKFFVILEGVAEVRRNGSVAAELGPGDFFGEEGILTHERRNADVLAVSDVRVAIAIGWDVRDFMDEFPRVSDEILRQRTQRTQLA